jgi:hypothetical protein
MKDLRPGPGVTALVISGAINNPAYLGPESRSGAHHAWLECNVKGAFIQVFRSQEIGGRSKSLHLCMRRNIHQPLGQVVAPGDDPLVANNDGPSGTSSILSAIFASFRASRMKYSSVYN